MKIGIYTDAHYCQSSSLLAGSSGSVYPLRLSSLIKSFQWMYDEFEKSGVSCIFNLGDLLSSHTIDAETNTALEEALSYSKGLPEYWLIGNHEMKSHDSTFTSLSLLKRNENIMVIDDHSKFEIEDQQTGDAIQVLACSYRNDEKELERLCSELSTPTIVLSHQIYTRVLPTISGGVDIDLLLALPNVKRIFNGHIHTVHNFNKYCQVGSLVGGSFGDKYGNGLPGIVIYDTETDTIERLVNPYGPLYYTIELESDDLESEIRTKLDELPESNPKFIRFRLPLNLKEEFSKIPNNVLQDLTLNENVVAYRTVVNSSAGTNEQEFIPHENFRSTSIIDSLKSFVMKSETSTPYEKSEMIEFVDKYLSSDTIDLGGDLI